MKAWHFTNGNKLWDGSPLPAIGETLRHTGELIVGQSGLHASKRLIDALDHARGNLLHRVELSGAEAQGYDDKLVARERTILWSVDAEPILRDFARRCALDVAHLWDAPGIVVQYLKTGDWRIQAAARDAARTSFAQETDWDAARYAAWDAARYAAWAAAARGAARGAARDAVALGASARDAARRTFWASDRDDVRAASKEKQNRRLTSMAVAAYKRQSVGERMTHK